MLFDCLLKCLFSWLPFLGPQPLRLVWSDEFNEDALNTSKWSFQLGGGGWGNNELQYYTNRTENIFIKDGYLIIKAKNETFQGANYTSGRIMSKNKGDWKYGRFEIRAKLPDGQGLWPALWMLPTNYTHGPGIASGELDIMELIGRNPDRVYGTAHWGNSRTDRGNKTAFYKLPNGTKFSENFHKFSLDWSENKVEWFVDDHKYLEVTPANVSSRFVYPFDDPFYLLLNVAVGGNWPGAPNQTTVFPQTMTIDYVRVYQ